jgi:hypothetical protein
MAVYIWNLYTLNIFSDVDKCILFIIVQTPEFFNKLFVLKETHVFFCFFIINVVIML